MIAKVEPWVDDSGLNRATGFTVALNTRSEIINRWLWSR